MNELCKVQFFLSITFESIIWNNKIQIYQNYKALNSKDIIPFWSPTSLLGSVLWRFVHVLACVCLGWCWVPPALASHPHGNEHSLGLPALHSGHTKGTLLSSEITALLDSPEINKRNSASTGSTHLATVHYTLYLPGENTDVQPFPVWREKTHGTRMESQGQKNRNLPFRFAFALWALSAFHQILSHGFRQVILPRLKNFYLYRLLLLANKWQLLVSNISGKKTNQIRSITFNLWIPLCPCPSLVSRVWGCV